MWLFGLRTNRVQASVKVKAHSKECQTRQIAGVARSELEDREFLIFPHSGERVHLRTCVHVRSKRGRVTRIINPVRTVSLLGSRNVLKRERVCQRSVGPETGWGALCPALFCFAVSRYFSLG